MVRYSNMTRVILLSLQSNPRQNTINHPLQRAPSLDTGFSVSPRFPSNTNSSSNRKMRRLRVESRKVGDDNLHVLAPNSYRTRKNPTPPSQLRAYTNLPRIGRRRKTPISVNSPFFFFQTTNVNQFSARFFQK
jgi:hypothetical protein